MPLINFVTDAGWSSLAARRAHNPKVVGSNPAPATKWETALGVFSARLARGAQRWAEAHFLFFKG